MIEKKYILAWLGIAVVLLLIADICSTDMILMAGGYEFNSLMNCVVGSNNTHLIIKLIAWSAFMSVAVYLEKFKSNTGIFYLMAVGGYFMFVVLHNSLNLAVYWLHL